MKRKVWRICKIIGNVVLYTLLAVALCVVLIATTMKKDADGTADFFGKQLRIVQSDSMASCAETDVSGFKIKALPVKTLIAIETVPSGVASAESWYRALKVGDVLTFRYHYGKQITITHRIVAIEEKETGRFLIELAGDNKASDSKTLKQTIDTSETGGLQYVIGKVVWSSYPLGKCIYALRSPVVIVCVIIIPCVIVIVLQLIRIINAFKEEKQKKEEKTAEKKDEEIKELKRRIATLEKERTRNVKKR